MSRTTKDQSGFAAIETLLFVVVLLMIGGIGIFVYHSSKKASGTLTSATSDATNSPATKKKASTTPSSASTGKTAYLAVKEWGVEMPLTRTTSDAYYVMSNATDSALLSLDGYKGTPCAADQTSLGLITRFTATQKDSDTGATLLSEQPDALKVGSYYYSYEHPQAGCADNDSDQAKASAAMTVFAAQAKKLQPIAE